MAGKCVQYKGAFLVKPSQMHFKAEKQTYNGFIHNTGIQDEPARVPRMKFRAMTLVAALYLSCLGSLAIAQQSQSTTDKTNTPAQSPTAQTQSTDAAQPTQLQTAEPQSSEPKLNDK